MRHVSYSELSTFQQCPRRHRYVYRDGRVPASTDEKLRFGTLMHDVTAAWWTGGPEGATGKLLPLASDLGLVEAARASAMLRAYRPPADQYEVVGVEEPFSVPLRSAGRALYGVRLHGYADMILRERSTGRVIVREYKTTTSTILGYGPYWARLAIDAQVAIYHMAFRAYAVVYDVSRKPELRPSKEDRKAAGTDDELAVIEAYRDRLFDLVDAEPEEWHQWRVQWKSEQDLREAAADLEDRLRMLQHAELRGLYPMSPGACRGIYGVCPYLEVCTGRIALGDDTYYADRVRRAA